MKFFSSVSACSDEELMAMLAKGSDAALTELYNRYSSKLLRYFTRMLWNNVLLAEDSLHDLFLKIIDNPSSFDTQRRFSTWIYSVANNMCKNEYRRSAYRKSFIDGFRSDEPGVAYNDGDEESFAAILSDALAKLDEDDRNLYVLRYEIELPLEEISHLINCPVGTIKSRSFYLKKKVANMLSWYRNEKMKYG